MTNPRTSENHPKFGSRSQLFAILTDFDTPQGAPKPPQSTEKTKKSEAKKSLKNRPSTEPPKMSFGYL